MGIRLGRFLVCDGIGAAALRMAYTGFCIKALNAAALFYVDKESVELSDIDWLRNGT